MSQVVACRNCGSQWTLPPQVTGQIPCPKCGQPLLTSVSAAVPTPPPPPQPPPPPTQQPATSATSALGNLNLRGKYRSAAQRTFLESKSPLDLFDWKFEKYLTPWIVRITWIAVLVISTLWLFFVMVTLALSLLPDVPVASSPAMPPFDQSTRFSPSPRFETDFTGSPWLWRMVGRIFVAVTSFVSTIIGLLWIRVVLEGAIVIFNIAKTLASIDEKTVPVESTT